MKNSMRFFCLYFLFSCSLPAKAQAGNKVNARSFGFLPSATAKKNTIALQLISTYINKLSGGVTLIIDKGNYIVGTESFAGNSAKGYAYRGDTLLRISNCTKPVIIEGNGAVIKFANRLHFGSFNGKTGAVHNAPPGGFYKADYLAYPQIMIDVSQNKFVTIRNLILDGNVQHLAIGGYWGDTGIQLPGDGIVSTDNDELTVDHVVSRYFPRDGIIISNKTPNANAPVKKAFLLNCIFDGNVRQGLSWVGGNHLYAFNCQFINTGKTVNVYSNSRVQSAPGAGIDMEAEQGLIRNGVFENCIIDNNTGAGFLSVGDLAAIAFLNGKIIGATSWSIYGAGAKASFQNSTIVGSPVNLRMGKGPDDPDNARFNNCLITLDSTLSPTGKVYGNYVMDFGGGAGGFFTNCTIDSKKRGTVYGGSGCVFTDCIFKQEETAKGYNGYPFMSGNFYGVNKWYKPSWGLPNSLEINNLATSRFYGPFYINDVKVADKK